LHICVLQVYLGSVSAAAATPGNMGLFSCLVPSQQQASDRVSQEVQELRLALASAQKHVTQLQADRSQLLHDLASRPVTPSKQDAATEIATVSVAVQVKPPVTMESRIPRPTGEDAKDADGSKAPAKTRIPAPPIAVSAVAVAEATAAAEVQLGRSPLHSPARSPSRSLHNLLSDESMPAAQRAPSAAAGEVVEAPLPAAASPRGVQLAVGALRVPSHPDAAALVSPKAAGSEQQGVAAPAAGTVQRVEVLQQQLKVTEAFRTSLEAELRDARFANTNLQTQMLSLQTKFEKTVEEQLAEVERLMQLRKEGQDAHEQAIQQVHALRHQLELQGQATASAQREAQAAAKHAPEQEQRVQQAEAEVARVREELAGCAAELEQRRVECSELAEQLQAVQQRSQSADVRVLQLQAVAQQADEAHRAAMKQVGSGRSSSSVDCVIMQHYLAPKHSTCPCHFGVAADTAGLASSHNNMYCCLDSLLNRCAFCLCWMYMYAELLCSFHLLLLVLLLLLCRLRMSCVARRPFMTQQWRRCCS
jgi:hypothetical protein